MMCVMSEDLYSLWLGLPPGPRPPDHFTLLGIDRTCVDAAEINAAAQRRLAAIEPHVHHPRNDKRRACAQMMQQIRLAASVLADPPQRAAYRATLERSTGLAAAPITATASVASMLPYVLIGCIGVLIVAAVVILAMQGGGDGDNSIDVPAPLSAPLPATSPQPAPTPAAAPSPAAQPDPTPKPFAPSETLVQRLLALADRSDADAADAIKNIAIDEMNGALRELTEPLDRAKPAEVDPRVESFFLRWPALHLDPGVQDAFITALLEAWRRNPAASFNDSVPARWLNQLLFLRPLDGAATTGGWRALPLCEAGWKRSVDLAVDDPINDPVRIAAALQVAPHLSAFAPRATDAQFQAVVDRLTEAILHHTAGPNAVENLTGASSLSAERHAAAVRSARLAMVQLLHDGDDPDLASAVQAHLQQVAFAANPPLAEAALKRNMQDPADRRQLAMALDRYLRAGSTEALALLRPAPAPAPNPQPNPIPPPNPQPDPVPNPQPDPPQPPPADPMQRLNERLARVGFLAASAHAQQNLTEAQMQQVARAVAGRQPLDELRAVFAAMPNERQLELTITTKGVLPLKDVRDILGEPDRRVERDALVPQLVAGTTLPVIQSSAGRQHPWFRIAANSDQPAVMFNVPPIGPDTPADAKLTWHHYGWLQFAVRKNIIVAVRATTDDAKQGNP